MRASHLLALLLLLGAERLRAQDAPPPVTNDRSGIDLFAGLGVIRLSGLPGVTGGLGATFAGVAVERPIGQRYSWRTELVAQPVTADFGRPTPNSAPTTLSVYRAGIAGNARRYGSHGSYVGLGVSLAAVYGCDFDLEYGGAFLGGETISCRDFEEIRVSRSSTQTSGIVTVGIERERLGLALRYDAGLQPIFATPNGKVRTRSLTLVLDFRVRRPASPHASR